MLESHHPAFSCPLCRTFADLEEDVEVEIEYEELDEVDGAFDKDVAGECDIDVDVEASDDQGHVNHHQAGLDDAPRSRSNSRLELRSAEREAGAETEVEGDGSGMGVVSRMRGRRGAPSGGGGGGGSGDRASPLADLTDEPDEEMLIDISQPAPARGEMNLVVVGGDTDEHMDVDGTVGAKRKR